MSLRFHISTKWRIPQWTRQCEWTGSRWQGWEEAVTWKTVSSWRCWHTMLLKFFFYTLFIWDKYSSCDKLWSSLVFLNFRFICVLLFVHMTHNSLCLLAAWNFLDMTRVQPFLALLAPLFTKPSLKRGKNCGDSALWCHKGHRCPSHVSDDTSQSAVDFWPPCPFSRPNFTRIRQKNCVLAGN